MLASRSLSKIYFEFSKSLQYLPEFHGVVIHTKVGDTIEITLEPGRVLTINEIDSPKRFETMRHVRSNLSLLEPKFIAKLKLAISIEVDNFKSEFLKDIGGISPAIMSSILKGDFSVEKAILSHYESALEDVGDFLIKHHQILTSTSIYMSASLSINLENRVVDAVVKFVDFKPFLSNISTEGLGKSSLINLLKADTVVCLELNKKLREIEPVLINLARALKSAEDITSDGDLGLININLGVIQINPERTEE